MSNAEGQGNCPFGLRSFGIGHSLVNAWHWSLVVRNALGRLDPPKGVVLPALLVLDRLDVDRYLHPGDRPLDRLLDLHPDVVGVADAHGAWHQQVEVGELAGPGLAGPEGVEGRPGRRVGPDRPPQHLLL